MYACVYMILRACLWHSLWDLNHRTPMQYEPSASRAVFRPLGESIIHISIFATIVKAGGRLRFHNSRRPAGECGAASRGWNGVRRKALGAVEVSTGDGSPPPVDAARATCVTHASRTLQRKSPSYLPSQTVTASSSIFSQ